MSPERREAGEAAERMLAKLREFLATLDDDERGALLALLAPGIAAAHEAPGPSVVGAPGHPTDDTGVEVSGFALQEVAWSPGQLPEHLGAAVRRSRFRIAVEPAGDV